MQGPGAGCLRRVALPGLPRRSQASFVEHGFVITRRITPGAVCSSQSRHAAGCCGDVGRFHSAWPGAIGKLLASGTRQQAVRARNKPQEGAAGAARDTLSGINSGQLLLPGAHSNPTEHHEFGHQSTRRQCSLARLLPARGIAAKHLHARDQHSAHRSGVHRRCAAWRRAASRCSSCWLERRRGCSMNRPLSSSSWPRPRPPAATRTRSR